MRASLAIFAVAGWAVLAGAGSAPAADRPAAQPATAPTVAAATRPATRPVLDAEAVKLIKVLREQELISDIPRMHEDLDGRVVSVELTAIMATDDNVRMAAHLPDLVNLKIYSGGDITPGALGTLGALKHLESLELRGWSGDFSLGHGLAISQIKSLHSLILSGVYMSPDALIPLGTLTELQGLSIRYGSLNDCGAAAIASMQGLEVVDLSGTEITDASLNLFATLPNLQQLRLRHTRVTRDGVLDSHLSRKVIVTGVVR